MKNWLELALVGAFVLVGWFFEKLKDEGQRSKPQWERPRTVGRTARGQKTESQTTITLQNIIDSISRTRPGVTVVLKEPVRTVKYSPHTVKATRQESISPRKPSPLILEKSPKEKVAEVAGTEPSQELPRKGSLKAFLSLFANSESFSQVILAKEILEGPISEREKGQFDHI